MEITAKRLKYFMTRKKNIITFFIIDKHKKLCNRFINIKERIDIIYSIFIINIFPYAYNITNYKEIVNLYII